MRKILVVDDNPVNRALLQRILSRDYQVLEAANGQEALELLAREGEDISVMLLDLVMPILDGYQVLERLSSHQTLSRIPVIVATGSTEAGAEVKALSLGAHDFVTKPYNPEVIRHRVGNTIKLRETASTINALQRDKLTGLYNRQTFFEKAAELIASQEPGYYVLSCFDIDNFKMINDQYGSAKGDEILQFIAQVFRQGFEPAGGLCCRIMADNFAALYPRTLMSSPQLEEIQRRIIHTDGSIRPITYTVGRYLVDDLSLPVSAMYDRAYLAGTTVKGRFDVQVAQYDESMRQRFLREQDIISEMGSALAAGQFQPWFQPQYNHSNGALIGAEALTRWLHPQKGLITPGDFIPVFERNGFIYELDKYIWERCCVLLRGWLDQGCQPLPLSVNLSRYDIFQEDLVPFITGLVERYDIPVELLRLEITESAFARSTRQVVQVVRRLVDYGFILEIDDFGSGYSSLNTLKDVPAHVLKLDMRFLESEENSQRGGSILESVVRMSKWLGMTVIAEGVETQAQADFLRSVGCSYVQGFLYGRPVPLEEYQDLLDCCGREQPQPRQSDAPILDNEAFWDPASLETLIFNSYVGGACIFEYYQGRMELLRANEKYAQVLGGDSMTLEQALELSWADHLDSIGLKDTTRSLEQAIATGQETSCQVLLLNVTPERPRTWLRATLRVIARSGQRCLIYCTSENITAQREAEEKIISLNQDLVQLMDDTPGGFARLRLEPDGALTTVYVNEGYCRLLGASQEEVLGRRQRRDALAAVHPDDVEQVRASIRRLLVTGETRSNRHRRRREDGSYIWLLVFGRRSRNQEGQAFINLYITEAPEEAE